MFAFISLLLLPYFDLDLRHFYLKDNEVLIEEIQDDDSNSYMDMPSLIDISSRLYLSHTNPPFIYQYVGDQVKIIKVLGQLPLDDEFRPKGNTHIEEDQTAKNSFSKNVEKDHCSLIESLEMSNSINEITKLSQGSESTVESSNLTLEKEKGNVKDAEDSLTEDQTVNVEKCPKNIESDSNVTVVNTERINNTLDDKNNSDNNVNEKESTDDNETESVTDNFAETLTDNYSSDDEASYGTPTDSPNAGRKLLKGKYGKNKAPLPPVVDKAKENFPEPAELSNGAETSEATKGEYNAVAHESYTMQQEIHPTNSDNHNTGDINVTGQSQESIRTQDENQSNSIVDNLDSLDVKRTRQKSKSPLRSPKSSATASQSPRTSGFGKLLQLPSKLAFWHKTDEKLTADDFSLSSGEKSRKSSADDLSESFQNEETLRKKTGDIIEVPLRDKSEDEIRPKEAKESDNESTTRNIIDKSDILQQLIVAKIESHPEYKYAPSNAENEISTASKSTDV